MTQTINRNTRTYEVTNQEVEKMELNYAIFFVITHDIPKKEMKEQVRLVKKAGYEVNKGGRKNWTVYNPVTHKYVSGEVRYREITIYNNGTFAYKINIEDCNYRSEYWDRCKVDFVGILTTPVNRDWHWVRNLQQSQSSWWFKSPTQQKFDRLKSAKDWVRYSDNHIKETQKKIEELQKQLIHYAQDKVKKENELNEVRKKLGLRTR